MPLLTPFCSPSTHITPTDQRGQTRGPDGQHHLRRVLEVAGEGLQFMGPPLIAKTPYTPETTPLWEEPLAPQIGRLRAGQESRGGLGGEGRQAERVVWS